MKKIVVASFFLISIFSFYFLFIIDKIDLELFNYSGSEVELIFVCNKNNFDSVTLSREKNGMKTKTLRPSCEGELGFNIKNTGEYFKLLGYVPVNNAKLIKVIIHSLNPSRIGVISK